MDMDPNTVIFRLGSVTRINDGISCVVTIQDPHSENTCFQRIVYHDRGAIIEYAIPEAPFAQTLKEHEDLLKKIISISLKNARLCEIDIPFVFSVKYEKREVPENAI